MNVHVAALDAEPAVWIDRLEVQSGSLLVQLDNWGVSAGARLALIGCNGAGKTTIMESMLGLRRARAVAGRLLGHDLRAWRRRPELRQQLGVLLQRASLPGGLLIREIVALHRALYRLTSERVIQALGIEGLLGKPYRHLSRGETQRVDLFLALAHEPRLMLLDEPFTGLDNRHARAVADLLMRPDCVLIMCCHSPEELAIATDVAWIDKGRLRASGPPAELQLGLLGEYRLKASFAVEREVSRFADRVALELSPTHLARPSETSLVVYGNEALLKVAHALIEQSDASAVEFGRTSLEDLLYYCSKGNVDV